MNDKTTVRHLVYQGQRWDDSRIWHQYQETEDDNLVGKPQQYKKTLSKRPVVGSVVAITFLEDGRYYSSGQNAPKYVRMFYQGHDNDGRFVAVNLNAINQWKIEDDLAKTQRKQKELEKKAMNRDTMAEMTLGDFRAKYRTMTLTERKAAVASLLMYLGV